MRNLTISVVIAIISMCRAHSAQLLGYTFGTAGSESTVETAPGFAPTIFDTHLTATPVQDPLNTVGLEISSAATTPPNAPFLRLDPQGSSTSPATAISNNKYYQFTLTPESGYQMTLDSITFDVARGGGSTPRGYVLRSSVDNYTADLSAGDLLTARPTYTPVSVTLGPNFSGVTSPVSFRFYNYAPAAGNSIDYDNIIVNGTLGVVPEPSSIALLLLGGASLCFCRRNGKKD